MPRRPHQAEPPPVPAPHHLVHHLERPAAGQKRRVQRPGAEHRVRVEGAVLPAHTQHQVHVLRVVRQADLIPASGIRYPQIGCRDDLVREDHLTQKPIFIDWKAVFWGQWDWELIAVIR